MDPQPLAVAAATLVVVAVLFLLLGRRLAGAGTARLASVEAELRALAAAHMQLQRQHAEEATLVVERTRERDQFAEALRLTRADADAQRTERAKLTEKLALLQDSREAMKHEFKHLADETLKLHGETLSKQNRETLDGVLNPLRLGLVEFKQSLQTAHTESEKARAVLADQIKRLTETSTAMSRETHDLTQALKGKSQTQGAWGEMILQSILEKSGLREGEEYVVQQSHTNDAGDRLRPDVIVRLPNRQSIVIDAKVSLTAFAASVAAETEAERAGHLKSHALSMRQHVRTLARKEYQKHAEGALDYVVMFVPIEGALMAALSVDAELTSVAVEGSVYIATPTTLMIALRTAANVWHVERRNRNAEEIAARAGRIYDKVFGFVASMERVGKALESAQDQYGAAMGQLSRGKGHVLGQLQQLKALGAKTNKSLPAHLLDDDETEAPVLADETAAE
jgi:DNA recombination protein RmuC